VRVLIADDEAVARKGLRALLATEADLTIVGEAATGEETEALLRSVEADVLILDIQMPQKSGLDVVAGIDPAALPLVIFATAHDEHAIRAFELHALDYLVKPVEPARLADTVARLKERLHAAQPAPDTDALLGQLATHLQKKKGPAPLQWIRASVGQALRLIPVEDIDFLRSDEKYTLIAWRGDAGKPGEALIRTPLKELVAQLDATHFVQVHRSVVVNLRAISHVTRGENETADIHLKARTEVLPVSRSYLHLFRQM